jgi:hypothetical protein
MSTSAPDPVIHNPQRLRIVATLAALPEGDTLSVSRLQTIIGLCELGHAGYVRTTIAGDDGAQSSVALTRQGRAALDHYIAVLTATTYGDLSQAAQDLPDLAVLSARVSPPRRKRARPAQSPAGRQA